MKRTHIVAGIIFNSDKSKVFITLRSMDKHKGGFWEFPGGKVEQGESIEKAMERELFEEVGIRVTQQSHYQHLEYDYPDKSLKFDFISITGFEGEPFGKEGQQGRWVSINELGHYDFPEANLPTLRQVVIEFGSEN
ncbi:8-oxo-dGTP diphosphatase MutT [Vibrio sp. FNV 38]|nr:8-oxo-dGTP diphosphatase MutT [Vibrio sp. FNV 38]